MTSTSKTPLRDRSHKRPPVTSGHLDRDVYSVKELSEILGLYFETIHDEIRRGNLDAFKIGGAAGWRIRHEAVMRWIMKREEQSRHRSSSATG